MYAKQEGGETLRNSDTEDSAVEFVPALGRPLSSHEIEEGTLPASFYNTTSEGYLTPTGAVSRPDPNVGGANSVEAERENITNEGVSSPGRHQRGASEHI